MGRYDSNNLNIALTGFSLETMRQGGPYVADRLAPVVRVPRSTGKYYKFANAESLKDDFDMLRAPGTKSNEIARAYSEGSFACSQYGLRENIRNEEMRDSDRAVIDPERDSALAITNKLLLGRDVRVCAKLMDSSVITNTAGAGTTWNSSSGVDIKGDIDTAKLSVRKKCGMPANTIVIPPAIAVVMANDSNILDRVKHTDPTLLVNGDLPPKLFGLDVVIPTVILDEAANGVATPSYDFLYDDNSVLVAYVDRNPNPSKRSMSLAYTFRAPVEGQPDLAMFSHKDEDIHCQVVEGLMEEVVEVVCVGAGYLITTVLTL